MTKKHWLVLAAFLVLGAVVGVGGGIYVDNNNVVPKTNQIALITSDAHCLNSLDTTTLEFLESSGWTNADETTTMIDMVGGQAAYGTVDLVTSAGETYDVYRSDVSGNPQSSGQYVSFLMNRSYSKPDIASGNNVESAVLISKSSGLRYPAVEVASKSRGASLASEFDDQASNALGEPNGTVSYMGDLTSRLTLGYPICAPATPSPSPSPTPAPTLMCTGLAKDVPTPSIGSKITFTCSGASTPAGAVALTYSFRYGLNGGAWSSMVNKTATTSELIISACGSYEVQCRACGTINGATVCDPVWSGATL